MTTLWELLAGTVVFTMVIAILPYLRKSLWLSFGISAALIGVSTSLGFQFGGIFIATFEPFGVVLPMVCAAAALKRFGLYDYPLITPWEKLGFAVVLVLVVLGALGMISNNIYAWFYTGAAPLIGALLLAAWAALRGQLHILLAVALGQSFWLLDTGSSNLYDHLSHVLLVPIMVISAALAGLRKLRLRKPS